MTIRLETSRTARVIMEPRDLIDMLKMCSPHDLTVQALRLDPRDGATIKIEVSPGGTIVLTNVRTTVAA